MNGIKLKIYFCYILFLSPFYSSANPLNINLCYTEYKKSNENSPSNTDLININILKEFNNVVLKKHNMEIVINFAPLLRCMDMLKKGEMDGMMGLSYTEERSQFLNYPPGSSKETEPCASKYYITCSGYAVATHNSQKFEYQGDPKTLPKPIRITTGVSIVNDFKKIYKYEDIEYGKTYYFNIKKLIRDKNGSVIANFVFNNDLLQLKKISPEIKIHKKYYTKKSYYIPFSNKSKISEKDRLFFWENVSKFYNDANATKKIFDKYK